MHQKSEFGPSKNTDIVKHVHQNNNVNNFVFRRIPFHLKFYSNTNNISSYFKICVFKIKSLFFYRTILADHTIKEEEYLHYQEKI